MWHSLTAKTRARWVPGIGSFMSSLCLKSPRSRLFRHKERRHLWCICKLPWLFSLSRIEFKFSPKKPYIAPIEMLCAWKICLSLNDTKNCLKSQTGHLTSTHMWNRKLSHMKWNCLHHLPTMFCVPIGHRTNHETIREQRAADFLGRLKICSESNVPGSSCSPLLDAYLQTNRCSDKPWLSSTPVPATARAVRLE